jgi:hypothetical protein
MSRFARHILIPCLAPAVFLALALTPVHVIGCRTRGLLALTVSLVSGLLALGTAIVGAKARLQGDSNASWWVISSLVLTIPVAALIALA